MLRHEKVREALKREVSKVIHDQLRDNRLGFVTVTKAQISQDMKYVYIHFSVFGKDDAYKKTKAALDSAKGYIKKVVADNMELRCMPDIIFKEDKSSEYSSRIDEVLNEIKEIDESKKSNRGNKKK